MPYSNRIEGKASENNKFTNESWSEVVKGGKVSQKLVNVPVRTNKVSINGKGVLTFDNEPSMNKAKELLSDDYKVSTPERSLPRLQILHLYDLGFDDKNFLQKLILEKNEVVSNLVKEGKVFDVLLINEKTKTAIIKVSPEIKAYLMKKRYVNVGLSSHRVEAHFYVLQCYKCQKFGHRAGSDRCPKKDESESSVCLYCCGPHKSGDCKFKKDKSKHKCSNCFEKGLDSYAHTSISNVCPFYQRALKGVKDNTIN